MWPWADRGYASRSSLARVEERIESVERKLPAFLVDMEGLAARCEEVLDRAGARANRARAAESRTRKMQGEEPAANGELQVPATPAQFLARIRRKRRGIGALAQGR